MSTLIVSIILLKEHSIVNVKLDYIDSVDYLKGL